MNKSYFIETYGCQMNVADTELVSAMLNDSGYEETNDINLADAIFVNTCAIREHAEDKVHSRLGFYHKNKKPKTINYYWCIGLYGSKFERRYFRI